MVLGSNTTRTAPTLILSHSGTLRFDIHAGPFTRDDQFAASPFNDEIKYIAGVPTSVAKRLVARLNNDGSEGLWLDGNEGLNDERGGKERDERMRRVHDVIQVEGVYRTWVRDMSLQGRSWARGLVMKNLTMGYVTRDVSPVCPSLFPTQLTIRPHDYSLVQVLATILSTSRCHTSTSPTSSLQPRRTFLMTHLST